MNVQAIYTNRENERWMLTDVAPLPFHPGFYLARRQKDDQQVVVHEHRMEWMKAVNHEDTKKS